MNKNTMSPNRRRAMAASGCFLILYLLFTFGPPWRFLEMLPSWQGVAGTLGSLLLCALLVWTVLALLRSPKADVR